MNPAVEAAKEAAKAEVIFGQATEQAGLLASENTGIVNTLAQQGGLSRTQALGAGAAAQRFATTAGLPGETQNLGRILTNLAASRGIGGDELSSFISRAQKERGRFTQEYLGQGIETIYRDYALKHRGELEQGYDKPRTVEQDVAGLSDIEKRRALAETLESKSGRFQNASAERAASFEGTVDRSNAAWNNATTSIGKFITTNDTLITSLVYWTELVQSVTGNLDDNKPGSGAGGLLTNAEIGSRSFETTFGRKKGEDVGFFRSTFESGFDDQLFGGYFKQKRLDRENEGLNDPAFGNESNRLYQQRNTQFTHLQEQGRVKITDPSQFNIATGAGFTIETQKDFLARQKKAFDELVVIQRELRQDEEKFNETLVARQAALSKLRTIEQALPQTQAAFAQGLGGDNPFVKPLTEMDTAGCEGQSAMGWVQQHDSGWVRAARKRQRAVRHFKSTH